ncbi:MAG: VCBS repeat-containing protein [Prevotella sp.]|nr:VCBS repeat-containing protein [Prevotella sp.]
MKKTLFLSLLALMLAVLIPSSVYAYSVGSPKGAFSVSPTGGAVYSISIDCPPGIGTMVPDIAITYNSQSGYGLAGYGTTLSGVSVITRAPLDIFHDGWAQGMQFNYDDALYLDGKRLIPQFGGNRMGHYTVEGDPFTEVIRHGFDTITPTEGWFEVRHPNGITCKYGETSDSRQSYTNGSNVSRINAWYINSAEDANTNYITYTYSQSNLFVYPTRIAYGMNRTAGKNSQLCYITFDYEALGTAAQSFAIEDVSGSISQRLWRIRTTTNGNIFRSYELAYSTTSDASYHKYTRLASVTEKNNSGESLPPVTFTWNQMPATSLTVSDMSVPVDDPNSNIVRTELQLIAADLNNDGYDDIIRLSPVIKYYVNYGSTYQCYTNRTYLYFSASHVAQDGSVTYSPLQSFDLGQEFTDDDYARCIGNISVGDFNGDGFNDMLIPKFLFAGDNRQVDFFFISGAGLTNGFASLTPITESLATSTSLPLISTCDIDGDGRTEIVYMEREKSNLLYPGKVIRLNSACNGFDELESFSTNLPQAPQRLFLGDYDNDGLADIIAFHSSGYKILRNYSNAGGISFNSMYMTPTSGLTACWRMEQGDFNGDGLADFVLNAQDQSTLRFALNNGNGTFTIQQAIDLGFTDNNTSYDDNRFTVLVGDIDRDGKSDVIAVKAYYEYHGILNGYSFNKTDVRWLRSTGSSLVTIRSVETQGRDDGMEGHLTFGDFDGDGCCELLNYGNSLIATTSTDTPSLHRYDMGGVAPSCGRVSQIRDGMYNTATISYGLATSPALYRPQGGTAYPVFERPLPLPVVSQVTLTDGAADSNTVKYQYRGMKIHMAGKGLLGFSSTKTENVTTGDSLITSVEAWDTSCWMPSRTKAVHWYGSTADSTVTSFAIIGAHNNNAALPLTVTETDADGNVSQTTYTYDNNHGVPLTVRTSQDNGTFWKQTTYSNYTSTGGQYLPCTIDNSQKHPDDASAFTDRTTVTYDSCGRAATVVTHAGTAKALTTANTYDLCGNMLSTTTTGSGVEAVSKTWQYESTFRFVTRSIDMGYVQTDYTYDYWGNVLTETDKTRSSFPQVTAYTYDGWGRPATVTSPEGLVTTYSRGWGNSDSRRCYVLETPTGAPWVKTWYDNAGRETRVESVGQTGVSVESQTTYNSKGLVTSRQLTEGQRTQSESITYDSRGRMLTHIDAYAPYTTYTYGNRSVTATANDISYTTRYDAWGNVAYATDAVGRVSYDYASCGKPAEASSMGASVLMGYDAYGNQTSLNDPDAGLQGYTYDALGRITSQTDGNGIETTNTYNSRGQLTQVTAGNVATTYTYGTGTADNGMLLSMTRGYFTESYQYDGYGRTTQVTRSYGPTVSRAISQTYNAQGLIATRTYPGGLTIGYVYDSYGNLTAMTHGTDTIYKILSYNGFVMTEDIGGVMTRHREFDNLGRLTASVVEIGGQMSHIVPQTYEYDEHTGNLAVRYVSGDYEEFFTYDDADRLTRVDVGDDYTYVVYDDNGNIDVKYGTVGKIGSYFYNGSRPHAVTDVEDPYGPAALPSDYVNVSYNELGKVSQITDQDYNGCLRYVYGPDGERWVASGVRTDASPSGTAYAVRYFGDYEERFSGTNVLSRFVYLDAGVLAVAEGNGSYEFYYIHSDHQGSIMAITDADGEYVFQASYDAWGRQTVTQNDICFFRGYTGHEMVAQGCLVNMNGRLYDPCLGMFLSPDNYVQEPFNSQNFNRYSYCLNNPLKYTDPEGEWIHLVIGAIVGGAVNLVTNWDNIDGFWEGVAAFVVGAGAGAAVAATGGAAGASAWSVIGVSAAGGAATSATNNIIAQTGKNFSGIGNINWGDVGKSLLVGSAAGAAGGAVGYYASTASFTVNGISSPALRSAVASPLAAGAGHVAGGTVNGLIDGNSLGESFLNSFDGIWNSMAIGGAIGVASTVGTCYAKGVNPWTGKAIHTIVFGNNENQTYHAFRHTDALSLEREIVINAIKTDIAQINDIPQGHTIIRIIKVNGIELQYNAYKLNDGTINVGRIHKTR